MILVTGGTGLVGSHLLYKLAQRNHCIRATYRKGSDLQKVQKVFSYYCQNSKKLYETIEWVEANLNDLPKLKLAFNGITHVYHCAALISFETSDYKILRKTNIKGTANIVNLCIDKNIKKLCYVSSVAALGYDAKLINEETNWKGNHNQSVYAISKYGAELEVWRGIQEGVDAVIVNPGVIIGPGFWNSGSGLLFKLVYKKQRYYTKGVTGYVGVDDVSSAMVNLMDSKIKNQRYILVSENLSCHKLLTEIAKELSVKPPSKMASKSMLWFALSVNWLQSKLGGKKRLLNMAVYRSLTRNSNYSSKKISSDLKSFEFTAVSKAIQQAGQSFLADDSVWR